MSCNCRVQTLIKDTPGIRTELPCILDLIILLSNLPEFEPMSLSKPTIWYLHRYYKYPAVGTNWNY